MLVFWVFKLVSCNCCCCKESIYCLMTSLLNFHFGLGRAVEHVKGDLVPLSFSFRMCLLCLFIYILAMDSAQFSNPVPSPPYEKVQPGLVRLHRLDDKVNY